MAVTTDILRTWRGPQNVVRGLLAGPVREDRAFAFLMGGCALVFLAQWPRLARQAHLEGSDLSRLVTYELIAWLIMWPLIFFLAAWVAHGASRALGGQGTSYGARVALFWSWLAATPAALVYGAVVGLAGPSPVTNVLGAAWLAAAAWFWVRSQREASRGDGGHDA